MTRQQITSGQANLPDTPSAGMRKVTIRNSVLGGLSCLLDVCCTLVGHQGVMRHRCGGTRMRMARTMATEPKCARRLERRVAAMAAEMQLPKLSSINIRKCVHFVLLVL